MFACPYRSLTGIPDGGCGTFRSLKALLHGDVVKSLYYNPLTLPVLLLLMLLPFVSFKTRLKVLAFIACLYVALTLVRLVLHLMGVRVPMLYSPEL